MNYLKEEMKYLKERERRKLMREISAKETKLDSSMDTDLSQRNSEPTSSDSESEISHLDFNELTQPEDN